MEVRPEGESVVVIDGAVPVGHVTTWVDLLPPHEAGTDPAPVRVPLRTRTTSAADGTVHQQRTGRHGATTVTVTDSWTRTGTGAGLVRVLRVESPDPDVAVQTGLALTLPQGGHRLLLPAMVYSPDQYDAGVRRGCCDARLAYPLVAALAPAQPAGPDTQEAARPLVVLSRAVTAGRDAAPTRTRGQSRYPQRTDLGSVGFTTDADATVLEVRWPYDEPAGSSLLDHRGTPASAFHPLDDGLLVSTLHYRVDVGTAPTFAAAVRRALDLAVDPASVRPTEPRVDLRASIDLRLDSAARTFAHGPDGSAGFVLNFDPERGYASAAKAFGASFTDHAMDRSHDLLEYGFTGRQLDLAARLAERDPDGWAERGAEVVDTFVTRMCQPSGWVHTLWDLAAGTPVFACGDPAGPVMHYLGRSPVPGTYTRMMTEAGEDLWRNIELHDRLARDTSAWRAAAERLADFLVRVQTDDGAWVRAYAPDGTAIVAGDWFGGGGHPSRTATGAVVPLLLRAAEHDLPAADAYRAAARRAGRYVLDHRVRPDDYRGGTLDNPNLVDKEAAFLAMRALLALHRLDGDVEWLTGAERAASVALSWHSLWPVPLRPGTPVAAARVRSVGWGGINSVWGAGVTDIYSLFFAADLHDLGRRLGRRDMTTVARAIATSSVQLLAHPGERYGFADTGMQPEGLSFCAQGEDDGLIRAGATWGGLGWPCTAGTAGLAAYLDAAGRDPDDPADTPDGPADPASPGTPGGHHAAPPLAG